MDIKLYYLYRNIEADQGHYIVAVDAAYTKRQRQFSALNLTGADWQNNAVRVATSKRALLVSNEYQKLRGLCIGDEITREEVLARGIDLTHCDDVVKKAIKEAKKVL